MNSCTNTGTIAPPGARFYQYVALNFETVELGKATSTQIERTTTRRYSKCIRKPRNGKHLCRASKVVVYSFSTVVIETLRQIAAAPTVLVVEQTRGLHHLHHHVMATTLVVAPMLSAAAARAGKTTAMAVAVRPT